MAGSRSRIGAARNGAVVIMGKFDSTIDWLQRQRTNATRALGDLQSGQRIEFDGRDVTAEWITRYERLVERYSRLIEMYEQKEREASLQEAVKFRE